jgi:hypothetical protein
MDLNQIYLKYNISVGNATQAIDFNQHDLTLVLDEVRVESVDQIVTDQSTNISN